MVTHEGGWRCINSGQLLRHGDLYVLGPLGRHTGFRPLRRYICHGNSRLGCPLSTTPLATLTTREKWDLLDSLTGVVRVGPQKALAGEIAQINASIDDDIRHMAKQGMTQAKIAEIVGRTQMTVSRRMRRLGLEPNGNAGRPTIKPPFNYSEEKRERALKLAHEKKDHPGRSASAAVAEIGAELGISERSVRRIPGVREELYGTEPPSRTNGTSVVACRTQPASEVIHHIELDVKKILSDFYTLNQRDKKRLLKVAASIQEELT